MSETVQVLKSAETVQVVSAFVCAIVGTFSAMLATPRVYPPVSALSGIVIGALVGAVATRRSVTASRAGLSIVHVFRAVQVDWQQVVGFWIKPSDYWTGYGFEFAKAFVRYRADDGRIRNRVLVVRVRNPGREVESLLFAAPVEDRRRLAPDLSVRQDPGSSEVGLGIFDRDSTVDPTRRRCDEM